MIRDVPVSISHSVLKENAVSYFSILNSAVLKTKTFPKQLIKQHILSF